MYLCEVESARPADSVSSLPPWGGGMGRVRAAGNLRGPISRPPPPRPPHKGEGSTPSAHGQCASNTNERAHKSARRSPRRHNRSQVEPLLNVSKEHGGLMPRDASQRNPLAESHA